MIRIKPIVLLNFMFGWADDIPFVVINFYANKNIYCKSKNVYV